MQQMQMQMCNAAHGKMQMTNGKTAHGGGAATAINANAMQMNKCSSCNKCNANAAANGA